MGYYSRVAAAVMQRNDGQFVQYSEIHTFETAIFVSWARPADEQLPSGWAFHANDTLRMKHSAYGEVESYSSDPVRALEKTGTYRYSYQLDLQSPDACLFHLVLPDLHLPVTSGGLLTTITPYPTYARQAGDGFVLGWIFSDVTRFQFTFEQASPGTSFQSDARRLEDAIESQREEALEAIRDRESLETQRRFLKDSLRYVEEQEALHGLMVPVSLRNERLQISKRIEDVDSRLDATRR